MTAILRALLVLIAMAVIGTPATAFAQSSLLQGGAVTPGHTLMYVNSYSQQPIVQDAGGAAGGPLGSNPSEIGLTSRGAGTAPFANSGSGPMAEHFCNYDAPTTNATGYHYLCLDANAQGGGLLDYGYAGGASSLPFQLEINGISYIWPAGGYLASSIAASTYETQAAAAFLAPLASPVFTGNPVVPGYLTTASAASTYLTTANAASTYLTSANAASTYLTTANAASTYLTTTAAGTTYETQTAAALLAPKASPTFTGTVTAPSLTTTSLLASSTVPVIASGFGTSPAIAASNGTAAFAVTIGSAPGSTGTLTMPAATHGWVCDATDITTQSASVFYTKETADSATTVVLTQYNDTATATAWTAADTLLVKCLGY